MRPQDQTETSSLTGNRKAHTIDCLLDPNAFTRSRKFECWEQQFLLKTACKTKDQLRVHPKNHCDTVGTYGDTYSSFQFPADKICGMAYMVRFCNNNGSIMEDRNARVCLPLWALCKPATQCMDGTLGRGVEYCLDIVSLLFCIHCCGNGIGKQLRTDKPKEQATEDDFQVRSNCAIVCRGNAVDLTSAVLCGIPIALFTILCSPCIACGQFNDKPMPEQFKQEEKDASGPTQQTMS